MTKLAGSQVSDRCPLGYLLLYVRWKSGVTFVRRCFRDHYANMSVQYTAIFHGCKNDNFQMKIFDIFLIFAQNIDCGYTLEPPQRVPTIYVLEQK